MTIAELFKKNNIDVKTKLEINAPFDITFLPSENYKDGEPYYFENMEENLLEPFTREDFLTISKTMQNFDKILHTDIKNFNS